MKGPVKRNRPESIKKTKIRLKPFNDGATLDEIGRQFGMTRQAVRDRFERAQLKKRPPKYQTIEKKRF